MNHGIAIVCRCGFTAEFERFCVDASGHELPRAQYRCPACCETWRRKAAGEWILRNGQVVPERIEIELIETGGGA